MSGAGDKLLRIDLPEDVWNRLNDEATENGMKIGLYLKRLIVERDIKRQDRKNPSA